MKPLGSPRCKWKDTIKMGRGRDRDQWNALANTVKQTLLP